MTFDVHGWNYLSPEKKMKRLAKRVLHILGEDPEKYWKISGKGFGLCICDTFPRISEYFKVPAWLGIESSNRAIAEIALNDWAKNHPEKTILRSSHSNEDFIDPRSGVFDSMQFVAQTSDRSIREILSCKIPVIAQEFVEGIGFVIDVCYSRLLEKPVVKIAHGGFLSTTNGMRFTSATWDFESRFGLYDAAGKPIIPVGEIVFQDIAPLLAKNIVKVLKELGIDFGVQLEMIIHPNNPWAWNLVQIRPSPGNVRGSLNIPKTKGQLIDTTLKVNKVGSAVGKMSKVSAPQESETVARLFDVAEKGIRAECDNDLQSRFRDNVILWSDLGMTRMELLKIVYAASVLGASGQLSFRTLFHNSSHKTIRICVEKGRLKYEEVRKKNILMGVSKESHKKLISRPEGTKLRLISDGLVGQIYLS